MSLVAHRFADLFPMMDDSAFAGLCGDIARGGLTDPIVLFEGAILDGRNRHKACLQVGATVHVRNFSGTEAAALDFVISKNLHRRHLSTSQRAMVAAQLSGLRVGNPGFRKFDEPIPQNCGIAADVAASMLNVSTRSVESARVVRDHGAPELSAEVSAGRLSVARAADVAGLSVDQQRALVALGKKEIVAMAKAIRAQKATQRRALRVGWLGGLTDTSDQLGDLLPAPILYADPPWKFLAGDSDRSVENHYMTMPFDELLAMARDKIAPLATRDAVFFCWVTASNLMSRGVPFIEACGFSYVTQIVWDKEKMGLGYWVRDQHEILVIATRGDFPSPAPGTQLRSVQREAREDHSEKPAFFAEWIEKCWPGVRKIELFCRAPRPGWDAWGNQAQRDGSTEQTGEAA